jgi:hypothetical protein
MFDVLPAGVVNPAPAAKEKRGVSCAPSVHATAKMPNKVSFFMTCFSPFPLVGNYPF